MEAKLGVWTPWALILCVECHGPQFRDNEFDTESDVWEELLQPQELKGKNGLTKCDKCGTSIQLDYDIAMEHELGFALKVMDVPATMEQTGGMNHALVIPCVDGGWYNITYNFEGDHLWWCSRQDEDASQVGEPFRTEKAEEMMEYVYQLEDVDYN